MGSQNENADRRKDALKSDTAMCFVKTIHYTLHHCAHTRSNPPQHMLPSLPPQATSPFYSYSSFNSLSPVAVLYSVVSQAIFGILKPTRWRLPVHEVPPGIEASSRISKDRQKVAIVTGSNTGIGLETARSLVDQGYEVVLACRSRDKALKAVESIRTTTSNEANGKAIFVHPLDLSSFESVKDFCRIIQQQYSSIDVLVNNAGLNTSGKSQHNLDLCFQSNHLGHFLLTHELINALLSNGGARVVNLSSVMHHYADATLQDRDYWKRVAQFSEHREQSAYTPSKLAALLFSLELNHRYGSKGLRSIAVNPGAVNSDIWRGKPRWLVAIFRWIYLTSKQGAVTSVAAAIQDDLPPDVHYLQPYWLPKRMKLAFPPMEMLGPFQGYRVTAPRLPDDGTNGIATAQHLWKASEELAGCVFE